MVAGQGRLNEKDGMTERERAVLSIGWSFHSAIRL